MDDAQQLRAALSEVYEARRAEIRISPAWLATETMVTLDPDEIAPALVYRAAHLQLRQLARAICRERFGGDGEPTAQHDLFPDLQQRYPAAHSPDAEPEYVMLEHLTESDVAFNVKRLRREAGAKLRSADALEAWWRERTQKAA